MKSTGYSGTPLEKKLGFKTGFKVKLVDVPDHYMELFAEFPDDVEITDNARIEKDLIHLFVKEKSRLIRYVYPLKKELKQNGMMWISWPKKTSRVKTDIVEDDIRSVAIQNGLVDIKVCAIDETWSALKLVIPIKERK
jgi:hypothetical protein